ncbi:hypothetical protein, partial [Achromobacter denitrificans]|uniref:hypothetical protein n=1 Tax=Achromobacter denitrificans TaxID=32002 RepID=UPI001124E03F
MEKLLNQSDSFLPVFFPVFLPTLEHRRPPLPFTLAQRGTGSGGAGVSGPVGTPRCAGMGG